MAQHHAYTYLKAGRKQFARIFFSRVANRSQLRQACKEHGFHPLFKLTGRKLKHIFYKWLDVSIRSIGFDYLRLDL